MPWGNWANNVEWLLDIQAGVVSRRQVLEHGWTDHDIERKVRRREWRRAAAGVFVRHTGPLTWEERGWVAVLRLAPAVLDADSALRAHLGPRWRGHRDDVPIRVAIEHTRRVHPVPGVRIRRVRGLAELITGHPAPPAIALEHAVIAGLATRRTDLDRVELLAQVLRSRRTTPDLLRRAIGEHCRVPRRSWLLSVVDDIGNGTNSVLEHGYLTLVERPHGLPAACRQVREVVLGALVVRDVEYVAQGVVVELDGRADHSTATDRDRDLARDLAAARSGRATIRLGWGQVFDHSCRTAAQVVEILHDRGWTGRATTCRSCRG